VLVCNIPRWITALACSAIFAISAASCARDVNGANPVQPYPNQVILSFQTRDNLSPDLWYYMVFNFTETANTTEQAPFPEVSQADRGRNWQLYVGYHPAANGQPEQWVTLQRPNLPTIFSTTSSTPISGTPSDAAAADLTGDNLIDIAIAEPADGIVQIVPSAQQINTLIPVYYDAPFTAYQGTAPRLVFASDFNADAKNDLLVLDAGSASVGPFAVVLTGQPGNDPLFTAGTPLALGGVPTDALLDNFGGDAQPDLAVLETAPGGVHNLVILLNNGQGVFTPGSTTALGGTPVELAVGELNGDGDRDVVVGLDRAGGTDAVEIYTGDGNGHMAAAGTRSVPATLRGVAVGEMNGSLDDVVVSYGADAVTGAVGVFLRNTTSPTLGTTLESQTIGAPAGYTLARDFGGDSRGDALVLNGDAVSGNQLTIMRGERLVDTTTFSSRFVWNTEPITYLTDRGPIRAKLVRLNGDEVDDFLTINAADDSDGPSVSLFFGLGKYNFTNADVYWTNAAPVDLINQQWHLAHAVGPNSISLTIDPGLFYDLARQPPGANPGAPPAQTPNLNDGFYVQFMVATSPIEVETLQGNLDQLGKVTDSLQTPVLIPMVPGTTNDEQQTPLANQTIAPIPSQDINYWAIEVD
jgi:hypothetical protein